MPKNNKKLWERQEQESPQAYEAFTVYRDLGVGRTFTTVAEKLQKSVSLIRRWKDKWDWEIRADAWDKTIAQKAIEQAAKDYAQMLEFQINLSRMMQSKGAKALQRMDLDNVPMKYLPSLVNMINSGVKTERSARDIKAHKERLNDNELIINIVPKRIDEGEEARVE